MGMSFPHGIEPTFVRVQPTPLYELAAGLRSAHGFGGGAANREVRARLWANIWR